MKIREAFVRQIDRDIEGVIKADDREHLLTEVDEFVITTEAGEQLERLLTNYTSLRPASGVWISGFFGSGKSHLLKMLALLLENRQVDGLSVVESFQRKCGQSRPMLKGLIAKTTDIPSQSILFNIDQEASIVTKQDDDAVLGVFLRVFNEACGYYGKRPHVAQFERDLDKRGLLAAFKGEYQRLKGQAWELGRETALLDGPVIDRAYAAVAGHEGAAPSGILEGYSREVQLSIADFADMVHDYVQARGKSFRLNFFVDELGQFVAGSVKLMTNVQTIAESLATRCRGQATLIVTAQEAIEEVIGDLGQESLQDFSKIQDRFDVRLQLTSANVDEVVKRRLLEKTPTAEACLKRLYERDAGNLDTLFSFQDGSRDYRRPRDAAEFTASYPFMPYQYELFKQTMLQLSTHNAFSGRHTAIGERSMLGVFQQVAVSMAEDDLGPLATFDQMYAGIQGTLRGLMVDAILAAERVLHDPFAVRVLKALFLVKYVREFRATPRNIRILLQPSLDADVTALDARIAAALDLLERQTFIERNGDVYAFLTNEEKDVEVEIKNTPVEQQEMLKEIDDLIFPVLKDPRIRHEPSQRDFGFVRMVDDVTFNRETELIIRIITPLFEHRGNLDQLKANAMAQPRLTVVLPDDRRFMSDVRLCLQTDTYVRQNSGLQPSESRQRILDGRRAQNEQRRQQLQARIRELLVEATLLVRETPVTVQGPDARGRLREAFLQLVAQVYPNLRMLPQEPFTEDMISQLVRQTTLAPKTEAETALHNAVLADKNAGRQSTIKSLIDAFEKAPYGWSRAAIQCLLAMLSARSESGVDLYQDGRLLERDEVETALTNSRSWPNVQVRAQPIVDRAKVHRLRRFIHEMFDRPAMADDARALADEARNAFEALHQELSALHKQSETFPFLLILPGVLTQLDDLAAKPYTFYLDELPEQADALLACKDDLLDPLRTFMGGDQKTIYQRARTFAQTQRANFGVIGDDRPARLLELLDDADCYRASKMDELATLTQALAQEIARACDDAVADADDEADRMERKLQALDDYQRLAPAQRQQVLQPLGVFRETVRRERNIAQVRLLRQGLAAMELAALNKIAELDEIAAPVAPPDQQEVASPTPAPVAPTPVVRYISEAEARPHGLKSMLSSIEDVDEHVERLRVAFRREISAGKRIRTL